MRDNWKPRSKSLQKLPEVSLITSWFVPPPRSKDAKLYDANKVLAAPAGVCKAVADGISLLDLYFLSHTDIPIYEEQLRIRNKSDEPQKFAADLSVDQIADIATFLREQLILHFNGRAVGRRPRFGQIASFFPGISVPQEEDRSGDTGNTRTNAIAALTNTLLLASKLGCSIVEAVGGSGVPGPESDETDAKAYRQLRVETLAASLSSVYERLENYLPRDRWPYIALELEPGVSFLLQDIETFVEIRNLVHESCRDRIRLNVDIAHFFMLGLYAPHKLPEEVQDLVAHFHISDHVGDKKWGGEHSSDLPPETFHFFDDYKPWLQFAIDRSNRALTNNDVEYPSQFSGMISVELESCNSNSEVLSTINLVRRWLREIANKVDESPTVDGEPNIEGIHADMHEGVLLAIDIGKSTQEIIGKHEPETGVWLLKQMVEPLCEVIRDRGGSVMSFTGDGFIALFEQRELGEATAEEAMQVAVRLPEIFAEKGKDALVACAKRDISKRFKEHNPSRPNIPQTDAASLTLRTSLHWGIACIPTKGILRDEIIGVDVVCATRLCECIADHIETERLKEEGQQQKKSGTWSFLGCTDAFLNKLPVALKDSWSEKPKLQNKVKDFKIKVYQYSPKT